MEAIIQTLLEKSPVTGISVALTKYNHTELFYQGKLIDDTIQENTVWHVASLTKPIFVFGILQLVQKEVIDLDRPLQSYLEESYRETTEDLSQVTMRHIITHTSGLPNWRDSNGLKLLYPIGKRFNYSSEGLNYLQIVVEHILKMPFEDYLQDNVFNPLGMTQSALSKETSDTISPNLSFILDTVPANGALSLKTTIYDYVRFIKIMLKQPDNKHPYLGSNLFSHMLSPQVSVGNISNLYWGFGWGIQGKYKNLSFWHWGARGIPKTMSFVMGLPEDNTVIVIFTNHQEGLYLCREIILKLLPTTTLPAFDWLLPAKSWRADGKISD